MTTAQIPEIFAENGTVTPIPKTTTDGTVSFDQGYSADYSRQLGVDPAAKPVERDKMNYLFQLITQNIIDWQNAGLPQWIANNTYAVNALVRYSPNIATQPELIYRCLIANNGALAPNSPTSGQWETLLGQASIRGLIPMPESGQITTATDFNSLGSANSTYEVSTDAIAAGSPNSPSALAGMVETKVWSSTTGGSTTTINVQRYIDRNGSVFFRGAVNGTWVAWSTISIPQIAAKTVMANPGTTSAVPVGIPLANGIVITAGNALGLGNISVTGSTNTGNESVTGNVTVGGIVNSTGGFASPGTTQGSQLVWNVFSSGAGRNEYVNNYGSGTGGHYFYVRSLTTGTLSPVLSVDATGNVTIPGAFSAAGNISSSGVYTSSGSGAILSAGTTGGFVALRPNGYASSTAQLVVDSAGGVTAAGAFIGNGIFSVSAAGNLLFRPNGSSSATNQAILSAAGSLSVPNINTNLISSLSSFVSGFQSGTTGASQGSYVAWNASGGTGEMDFINNHGGGTGGWSWYDTSGTGGTLTQIMTLSPAGALRLIPAGSFYDISDEKSKYDIELRSVRTSEWLELAKLYKRWNFKLNGKIGHGNTAQDMLRIVPDMVDVPESYDFHAENPKDYLAVRKIDASYEAALAAHVLIERLERRIAALESRLWGAYRGK